MERPLVISNLQCFLVLVRRPTVRWNSCYGGSNTSTGTRLYGSSSPAFPVRLLVHETSTFSKPCDVYAPMRGDEKDETDPAGRPQRTAAKTFFLSFLLVSASIARLLVPIDRTERNALSMEPRLADHRIRYPSSRLTKKNTFAFRFFSKKQKTTGCRKNRLDEKRQKIENKKERSDTFAVPLLRRNLPTAILSRLMIRSSIEPLPLV